MTSTGEAGRRPVRVALEKRDGRWRITAFDASAPAAGDTSAAADVVKNYYAALNDRDYARAYRCWW